MDGMDGSGILWDEELIYLFNKHLLGNYCVSDTELGIFGKNKI